MEVNTSAAQYGGNYVMPDPRLLKYINSKQIPLCLADDAHYSQDVGRKFYDLLRMLRDCDVKQLSYFENKQIRFYPLEDAIASFRDVDVECFRRDFMGQFDCELP